MRTLGALSEPTMVGGALRRPLSVVHHDEVIGSVRASHDVHVPVTPRMQGQAPSCCGFGFSQMVNGTAMMAGYKDQALASPRGIYTLGRMMYQRAEGPLDNNGAIPSYVADGLVRYGVPCETDPGMYYTDNDAALRHRMPMFDLMLARRYKVESIAVIDGEGPARCEALYRALSAGLVPAFAMTVDDAYMSLGSGDVYSHTKGERHGGHMQAFCGYRADGCFEIVGSWDWATSGFTWITPELVGDIGVVSQIFVARVVPHIPAGH